MREFSRLMDSLYYTYSKNTKSKILREYLANTSDPERGWALAAIVNSLELKVFKRALIKKVVTERVDPVLFDMSYDYVGETSETVAHIWPAKTLPEQQQTPLPTLTETIQQLSNFTAAQTEEFLVNMLDIMTPSQRWSLIKLGTGGFRIGVSARQLKVILAEYGKVDVSEIETLWHGITAPYTELLQWLDGNADKPDISQKLIFHPVMLAHPLDEASLPPLCPENWQIEWKYDGIRTQLCGNNTESKLFSRSGDDISHSFPDLLAHFNHNAVVDSELLVFDAQASDTNPQKIGSFNQLQQRINKKKPSKKLMSQYPAFVMLYDILALEGKDLTSLPLTERRKHLEAFYHKLCDVGGETKARFLLADVLSFHNFEDLKALREKATDKRLTETEGVMLKRTDSSYVAGRPTGQWYKWKKAPDTIDAILMYAQRGHGKRSSFYSDFTFGLWQEDSILPVGKAYSGFTDAELSKLDRWVRNNTIGKFGPVKEVEKSLVVEIAFDAVHESTRHKSGVALRFPRFKAIRWDKPANEADQLHQLKKRLS